ncbi:hypothetical protein DFQ27_005287 [Actinomortierella ambigua]|uniref:Uncharacterized protein n=1 Tax=Actinomortierella ambigua TaxID=1343610 RepID=A0A9P6U221_9FUNG|nr:hypothetical protein DFQ27_005287 [Actinomortierella ambigua]
MSTSLDAANPQAANNPELIKAEKTKLEQFTQPNTVYYVEPLGTKKEICRQEANGQKSCVQFLALEAKQMYAFMQDQGFFCILSMDPNETGMECRRV